MSHHLQHTLFCKSYLTPEVLMRRHCLDLFGRNERSVHKALRFGTGQAKLAPTCPNKTNHGDLRLVRN